MVRPADQTRPGATALPPLQVSLVPPGRPENLYHLSGSAVWILFRVMILLMGIKRDRVFHRRWIKWQVNEVREGRPVIADGT